MQTDDSKQHLLVGSLAVVTDSAVDSRDNKHVHTDTNHTIHSPLHTRLHTTTHVSPDHTHVSDTLNPHAKCVNTRVGVTSPSPPSLSARDPVLTQAHAESDCRKSTVSDLTFMAANPNVDSQSDQSGCDVTGVWANDSGVTVSLGGRGDQSHLTQTTRDLTHARHDLEVKDTGLSSRSGSRGETEDLGQVQGQGQSAERQSDTVMTSAGGYLNSAAAPRENGGDPRVAVTFDSRGQGYDVKVTECGGGGECSRDDRPGGEIRLTDATSEKKSQSQSQSSPLDTASPVSPVSPVPRVHRMTRWYTCSQAGASTYHVTGREST